MQTTVFDELKDQKQLDIVLAKGGEGSVYPLLDRQEVLVKCYHAEILAKNGPTLRHKITAMTKVKAQFGHPAMSWPLIEVFDANQEWIGYAMRRVSGVKLHFLAHALLYKKYFPNLNRQQLVQILLNLVQMVQQLHAQQVMIGDYNLNNFLCDPSTLAVGLIDCDSYQIQIGSTRYPCPVGSPDLTPLEHHGMAYANVIRNPASESFSLAIILFKCLMLGRHPYDVLDGEDPVSNLKAGRFAYGIGNKGIPTGDWYNIWSHMPHRIKSMFIQTFVDGATDPSQRPTLDAWHEALTVYGKELNKGWHESAIRPTHPKASNRRSSGSQG